MVPVQLARALVQTVGTHVSVAMMPGPNVDGCCGREGWQMMGLAALTSHHICIAVRYTYTHIHICCRLQEQYTDVSEVYSHAHRCAHLTYMHIHTFSCIGDEDSQKSTQESASLLKCTHAAFACTFYI